MDLATTYLGLQLPHPLMVGASPLVDDLGEVRRLEDAGAAAVVMHSLFEEQIVRERQGTLQDIESNTDAFSEASSFFPAADAFRLGPEAYLEQIQRLKAAVAIPIIASLNCASPQGWQEYASKIQAAGADALELNVYYLPTSPWETGDIVEKRTLDILRSVKSTVKLPVALKLSPYFSSMAHFAQVAESAGADALVLFNRFYQPDIDIEQLDVMPSLELSGSWILRLRMRWLAILYPHLTIPMAASGGVHTHEDAIKAIMAGATTVQMVSALLKHGPKHIGKVRDGLAEWMERHEYENITQMRGSMSLMKSPNPGAFERANYMRVLTGWRA